MMIDCPREITRLSVHAVMADRDACYKATLKAIADGLLGSRDPQRWEIALATREHIMYGPAELPARAAAPEPPIALKPDFNTGIVSMLTELLRRAQAGEINQVALVFTEPGAGHDYGTWISDRTLGGSTLNLIGAIAHLQHTALVLHNEQQKR